MLQSGLMIALVAVIGPIILLWVVLNIGPHFWTRRDCGGSSAEGVVVFAESVRWLGVRWGLRTVARGLRQAGFGGRFIYWRWHASWRGWLVLPAIMDSPMLECEAARLARFLERLKRRHPERPIYLVGYSCGGYVAVRALELLSSEVAIDGVATLAGAFSPRRDLSAACERVDSKLVVCSSVLDWCIIGIGTLVFGTADRKHTPSAGMVGTWRGGYAGLSQIRWRLGMIRVGHWGGHFAASCAGFAREYIGPSLGIGTDGKSGSSD